MPHFWDHFGFKSTPRQRNLQDGLFQIASQTCSLLVQVNNTNNISYGDNTANIHLNSAGTSSRHTTSSPDEFPHCGNSRATASDRKNGDDKEQLVVLIPPTVEKRTRSPSHYRPSILNKPTLSTVPETPSTSSHHEHDLWAQAYSLTDHDGSQDRWGGNNRWCRPSCIPITIICILIFLVVLLPVLDHATEKALQEINTLRDCNSCRLALVESIPDGLAYNDSSITHVSTYDTWSDLIRNAKKSIDIASLYWTLRQSEVYPDPSSIKGEKIFQALLKAGTDRGVAIRVAQNAPSQNYPNVDTEFLVKRKAAKVRSLNFAKLLGNGVLHTKMWIIDGKHVYIGSANMDWRALTQVKEMGIVIYNCTCIADDASKIFEVSIDLLNLIASEELYCKNGYFQVYWSLGENNSVIPDRWPDNLSTNFNVNTPLSLNYENETFQTYLSSSPLPFNPKGRTNDIDALLNVIKHAEKFIYIAVMDYFPLMIYTPKRVYWPVIDDALKTAAIEHRVKVKLLISKWNHSRPAEDYFLKSIADINNSYPGVSLEIRRFIVPANKEQRKIPFARVNHNKYMVTDNTAFIGTSNWHYSDNTNTWPSKIKMPLFGNKFSPKKTPLRKSNVNINSDKLLDDLVGEQRSIKIHLGGQELVFQEGQWVPSAGKRSSLHKSNQILKRKNQELQEENNLLRIKCELVMDMLTQTTAEYQLMEKEMEKLRKN
ncbi:unnamed protein product [Ceutorhynchus assimilis]|uniref:PLD phosphodiesterase domain-containing protein n=1 Tax=Ceutorhynchus assimilis TaxID=467358 RepID=A0A9N9MIZ1_9CUCU|nr:unnamed protein product [Ceutorhynchus assimilis]